MVSRHRPLPGKQLERPEPADKFLRALSMADRSTFGSELVRALAGSDAHAAARAAVVLRSMLDGNPAGKVCRKQSSQ